MDVDIFLIALSIVIGAIEIIMGIPLLFEKVKPNWIYGFRISKTVKNKDIWYKINKYTGRDIIVSGVILIIGELLILFLRSKFSINEIALISTIMIIVPIIIVIFRGFNYLKKL